MTIALTERAVAALAGAPLPVQRAFLKQISYLARNLQHPSLHAKKYNERQSRWQARINDDWRFYFTIAGNTYEIDEIISHPK
jgi:hypothetical protein